MTLRSGVTFQDGEKLDAAAVKFSIERHLNLPGSNRKAEISAVQAVEIVDDHTVKFVLSRPFAPLLAALSDRAGMIVSPKAARNGDFATRPVCAGPYKFVERVAQDRIVLDRFADYWNKEAIHVDRIVFLPIPDSTVRLANLRSGSLDLIERLGPTDVEAVRKDPPEFCRFQQPRLYRPHDQPEQRPAIEKPARAGQTGPSRRSNCRSTAPR